MSLTQSAARGRKEEAAMGRREASALKHNSAPRPQGANTMRRFAVPHPLGLCFEGTDIGKTRTIIAARTRGYGRNNFRGDDRRK